MTGEVDGQSVQGILLQEGCHVLGRDIFLPTKVPHVSRRHLRLDVRSEGIEVTVVGLNPAAITNLGHGSLRLRPGESALLKDQGSLEFLPGQLRFRVSFCEGESPCQAVLNPVTETIQKVQNTLESPSLASYTERKEVVNGEQLRHHLVERQSPRTPPFGTSPNVASLQSALPSRISSAMWSRQTENGLGKSSRVTEEGDVQPGAALTEPLNGGSPKHVEKQVDQIAQDEDLARRLQAEEGAPSHDVSHHSKAMLASDEAFARALQEHEEMGAQEGEKGVLDVEQQERERQRRDGGEEASTSGRSEGGACGSEGPGSFQLLQVHALPASANRGCCRISDVIRGNIQWCILTNYMVDCEWLLSACPILYHVPRVIVMHGEGDGALERLQGAKPANFSLHKPPLPISYGTHHSKAMFLVYPSGVRVVVHTANLIYIDWNNKTQGIWHQDFPLKTASSPPSSPFETDLLDYLEALRWPGALVPSTAGTDEATRVTASVFRRFDYSRAAVRLIASVPGYHGGQALRKWGHMKMRAVLEKEAFADDFRRAPLVYQFSSLGSLDEAWMSEFLSSLSQGRTLSGSPLGPGEVRVVWPTVEDVRTSIEGYCAGGAIPGPEKNVTRPWLQRYWAKFQADHTGRGRVMPHIKTFLRHRGGDIAWCLLGSANLSKAAWGSLQKKDTQLMVRSYELGVLFLPSLVAQYGQGEHFSCTGEERGAVETVPRNRGLHPSQRVDQKGGAPTSTAFETDDGTSEVLGLRGAAEGSALSHGKRRRDDVAGGPSSVRFVSTAEQPGSHASPSESGLSSATSAVVRLPIPYALPPAKYGPRDRPWVVDRQYVQPDVYGETWPRTVVKYGVQQKGDGAE